MLFFSGSLLLEKRSELYQKENLFSHSLFLVKHQPQNFQEWEQNFLKLLFSWGLIFQNILLGGEGGTCALRRPDLLGDTELFYGRLP